MKEIGLSVYPDFDDITTMTKTLDNAKKLGYTIVFTSMQLANLGFKNVGTGIEDKFQFLFDYCDKLGMEIHVDINAIMLKQLGGAPDNLKPIHDMKIKVLRLDDGFSPDEIALMTNNQYGIMMEDNASMLWFPKEKLETIVTKGNIKQYCACHNFFPLNETGLSFEDTLTSTRLFKSYGVKVGVFIGSLYSSGDLNDIGNHIITVEDHRYKPSHIQAMEFFIHDEYDYVAFGDTHPHIEELKRVSQIAQNDNLAVIKQQYTINRISEKMLEDRYCVELPVWFDQGIDKELKEKLTSMVFQARGDQPDILVRATQSRDICACACYQPIERLPFSLVIMNEYANRYNGEIQIPLVGLPAVQHANVIGQVKPYAKRLIEATKYGQVPFILKEE